MFTAIARALLIASLLSTCLTPVGAYSSGAGSCGSPGHGSSASGSGNYQLTVLSSPSGESVTVTLSDTTGAASFKGYIVLPNSDSGSSFSSFNDGKGKTGVDGCSSLKAWTHSNSDPKSAVSATLTLGSAGTTTLTYYVEQHFPLSVKGALLKLLYVGGINSVVSLMRGGCPKGLCVASIGLVLQGTDPSSFSESGTEGTTEAVATVLDVNASQVSVVVEGYDVSSLMTLSGTTSETFKATLSAFISAAASTYNVATADVEVGDVSDISSQSRRRGRALMQDAEGGVEVQLTIAAATAEEATSLEEAIPSSVSSGELQESMSQAGAAGQVAGATEPETAVDLAVSVEVDAEMGNVEDVEMSLETSVQNGELGTKLQQQGVELEALETTYVGLPSSTLSPSQDAYMPPPHTDSTDDSNSEDATFQPFAFRLMMASLIFMAWCNSGY
ncbi:hypothetical protein CYMTET_42546 [Cymbomonas tetramitiformis]|uniref:Reelin domain-containing protein n=1 Tax=Cymbomonas tetramitiformis TaxID=36881 RepID=A0AAE0F151_9CHLO|nr:hypothetical protein CYMTET_42546 [Cymbomonas tetramitiformis]